MLSKACGACSALLLAVLLTACSSAPVTPSVGASAPHVPAVRPSVDGAPQYHVDVSSIPDAVPTPHNGPYKASPYTVLGRRYEPMQDGRRYREEGEASWYGTKFHGQHTANGEVYDLYGMTAAHKTLPLPTYVQVTNLENGLQVVLRVNDRGPFYSDRIIDLSYAAAKKLGFAERGTARVRVEGIDPVAWQQQQNPGYLVTADAASSAPTPVSAGYYLQVGAFASEQSAAQLRSQLQARLNDPVFISPVQQNAQTLHRVRVGPLSSHAEAQRLIDSLRAANLGNPALVPAQ
ncbi:MAG: septal ring lytic transglycosylase RlpA family lipoprotein [Gammaproteobacteria bacterium HGW-Gammaproteobacteria-11]|nr:MAG: septal ring lytic transglycosylase RlpA family lipoprotein [Gammaproteobacteria bacterium HGW-Gammaproteobacteria-11]